MDFAHLIFLFLAIGVIALLYSSVGHAGASGYIATMTLFGLSTATIRPTALVLNILVALIGFLSGLTGTGGGIFLTPLLLFSNWAKTKQASAVSALFILVNSIAGLAGFVSARQSIPAVVFILSAAAIVGGAIGSYLGSRKF